jgi:hypothetical protein
LIDYVCFVSVGAGCSCGAIPTGKDDISKNLIVPAPLKKEYQEIMAKLIRAQEDIYNMISENLMLFYKQVGRTLFSGLLSHTVLVRLRYDYCSDANFCIASNE